jgi:hypothetical protein
MAEIWQSPETKELAVIFTSEIEFLQLRMAEVGPEEMVQYTGRLMFYAQALEDLSTGKFTPLQVDVLLSHPKPLESMWDEHDPRDGLSQDSIRKQVEWFIDRIHGHLANQCYDLAKLPEDFRKGVLRFNAKYGIGAGPAGLTLGELAATPLPGSQYLVDEDYSQGFVPIGGFCIDELTEEGKRAWADVLASKVVRKQPGAYGTEYVLEGADPSRVADFSHAIHGHCSHRDHAAWFRTGNTPAAPLDLAGLLHTRLEKFHLVPADHDQWFTPATIPSLDIHTLTPKGWADWEPILSAPMEKMYFGKHDSGRAGMYVEVGTDNLQMLMDFGNLLAGNCSMEQQEKWVAEPVAPANGYEWDDPEPGQDMQL